MLEWVRIYKVKLIIKDGTIDGLVPTLVDEGRAGDGRVEGEQTQRHDGAVKLNLPAPQHLCQQQWFTHIS